MSIRMSLRVLIIEDDKAFQSMLVLRLKSWSEDIQISWAQSLADAQAILDAETSAFDLIVLDQHLPDGMGPTILNHPMTNHSAVLAVSSDDSPELPGNALRAGAMQFLSKRQISEKSFLPMLQAIVERKKLENELFLARLRESQMKTVKTLLATLRHEINNPLGALFGGAYLIQHSGALEKNQSDAIRVIESSANRIRHVLEQLCDTVELEEVVKGHEPVYHIPGDAPWGEKKK